MRQLKTRVAGCFGLALALSLILAACGGADPTPTRGPAPPPTPVVVEQTVVVERTVPVQQTVIVERTVPVQQTVVVERTVPVQQTVVVERTVPVQQTVVVERTVPVQQTVVVERTVVVDRVVVATPRPQVLPAQEAQSGGTLRVASIVANPAHFDIHQSGTVANLFPQAPMFNGIVRYNPADGGQTIAGDLAHAWEVSDGGLRYTFTLRDGVTFHDGGLLTSADVVATYSRIMNPPEGITSPRKDLFRSVQEVRAVDDLTVEFTLSQPDALFLEAVAVEWNVIVRKQTLEDNNFDLKKIRDIPGTGPFRFQAFSPGEKWDLDKHTEYWNEGLPYLDGLEIFHALPPQNSALVLSGRADIGLAVERKALELAKERSMEGIIYNSSVNTGIWFNTTREPFSDPRVRKAIDLAADHNALIQSVKALWPLTPSRWVIPRTKFSLSDEELSNLLPLREDKAEAIAEAKRLMAEAGYADGFGPIDLLARQFSTHIVLAEGLQAMLKENLNIESNIRLVDSAVWSEEASQRTFDITISALGAQTFDPAEYMRTFYGTDGGANFSFYSNPTLDSILDQLASERDTAKRIALVRDAAEILEQDVPALELGYLTYVDIWHSHVKGVPSREAAGIYSLRRYDTVWLER